jgi:hypothetical protein
MAGGMGRPGRHGVPLGERFRTDTPPIGQAPGEAETSLVASGRHVWVTDAPEGPGQLPGLLLEWRRHPGGSWRARVIYAVPGEDRGAVAVERWLLDSAVRPR